MKGKTRPELLKDIERLEQRIREIEARGGSSGKGERIAGEERYRTIVQTSLDGFWINDMEGRFLDVNDAYCRIIGYSREELLRMGIPDVEAVEKPEETARHIKKIFDEGYDRFETQHRRKDGANIDIEVSATCMDVGGGQLVLFLRDITNRKKAEEELRASNQKLNASSQQLRATDQQLRASNQQLTAANQQLRATEQQLLAGQQLLRSSNRQLDLQARVATIFLTVADEEMFNEVLKVVLDVLHSPFGVFGFIDEEGALVVPTMTRQVWDKCQVPDKTIRFPRETWGDSSWPRAIREMKANHSNVASARTPAGHVPISRHISQPILFCGQVIGLFQVANSEADYTDVDLRTLEAIAEQIAPLLRARLQRERAELAVAESLERERFLGDLIRHTSVAVGVGYLDGRLGMCNPAFKRLTGYSEEELKVIAWNTVLTPPEWLESEMRSLAELHRTKQPVVYEKEYIHKSGKRVPIEMVVQPFFDADGNVSHYCAFITDITERKRAEEAILLRNKELTGLNMLGQKISKNLSLEQFIRNAIEEITKAVQCDLTFFFERETDRLILKDVFPASGKNLFDGVPEHRAGECMCGLAITQGKPLYSRDIFTDPRCTWEECKKAGLRSLAALPLHNNEEIIGVVGVASHTERDFEPRAEFLETIIGQISSTFQNARLYEKIQQELAERKRADDALRQSETKHRLLFESSRDAIMTLAPPSWRFASGNPATITMFGARDEADFTARPPWEYSPNIQPDGRPSGDKAREMIETAMREGSHFFEWTHRRLNGEDFPATVLLTRFELGGQALLQATVRDITGQRRAEEEREAMQVLLLQAQKLESLGTLAGGVAHEINNPIMGIQGYAALIADKTANDPQLAEYAGEIKHETERVATIVKNLLGFARQDKQPPYSAARACDIVEATLSLIRTVMRHDQITLEVDVPEDLPKIRCRSQQIQQVIMNLLTNVRDALNAKYPGHHEDKIVRISARTIADFGMRNAELGEREVEAAAIRITVEDHGCGIPEAIRQRIFEPFFTTKPRGKGTGLGLSISHGIVKDHGGALSVETEVGQWTRFHVDLPIAPEGETRNAE